MTALWILLSLLGACDIGVCDGLPDTLSEIRLSEKSHPEGWGEANCYACHALSTLHEKNCTGSGMTPEEILSQVDPDDPVSCQSCHGDNGVVADSGEGP